MNIIRNEFSYLEDDIYYSLFAHAISTANLSEKDSLIVLLSLGQIEKHCLQNWEIVNWLSDYGINLSEFKVVDLREKAEAVIVENMHSFINNAVKSAFSKEHR